MKGVFYQLNYSGVARPRVIRYHRAVNYNFGEHIWGHLRSAPLDLSGFLRPILRCLGRLVFLGPLSEWEFLAGGQGVEPR